MLAGAAGHSNEGTTQPLASWVRVAILVSLTTLWIICLGYCTLSTEFALVVEPPPSFPFELHIFSDRLDAFASSRLLSTFKLGRYHIDIYVGRRPRPVLSPVLDYAGLSTGGRTIEALTSTTYSSSSVFSWGVSSSQDNSPALALTDGMELGECWAFRGDAGQIGIQFTHTIHVSHVTVGYPNNSPTASSAPKSLIIWGLKPADSQLCTTLGGTGDVGVVGTPTPDFGPGYCGVHVLSGVYEVARSKSTPVYQNFTTNIDRNHYFDRMVVQVVNNWGNVDFTCVYRIQIYGRAQ